MVPAVFKRLTLFLFFLILFISGCGLRAREEKLQLKEEELTRREQAVLAKENALQLKEEELQQKDLQLDSTRKLLQEDSLYFNPDIVGNWSVTMNCIETTCTGSAVGDTKTEQWQITNDSNTVKAQVIENGALVRVYSGSFINNMLQLSVQHAASNLQPQTQMTVRLQQNERGRWEGRREIIRAEECRIVYALEMAKQ